MFGSMFETQDKHHALTREGLFSLANAWCMSINAKCRTEYKAGIFY